MVTYYRVVHWEFDRVEFANQLTGWAKVIGLNPIAEVVGVTPDCIRKWAKNEFAAGYGYPNMTNFLKVCDELSLDPRHFFTTSE